MDKDDLIHMVLGNQLLAKVPSLGKELCGEYGIPKARSDISCRKSINQNAKTAMPKGSLRTKQHTTPAVEQKPHNPMPVVVHEVKPIKDHK